MKKLTLTEAQIKDILRNKDQKIKTIHRKFLLLYETAERECLYPEAALSGMRMDSDGTPGSRGKPKDLSDVLEHVNALERNRSIENRKLLWALSEQEDVINRVWACFCALEDPFFTVLEELYVKGQLYAVVEKDFGYSHKTFENIRSEGIRLIQFFYESGNSAIELMKKSRTMEKPRRKMAEKKEKADYEQLSFFNDKNET